VVGARGLDWFRSHPIVCLAILTPGLPEYLSTSSPLLALVTNPASFAIQLAINVGQYTAGALLIREALIRWGKGWGSALALGLAYGVTEEGLGDNTLFNNRPSVDGILGAYGHFLGVNWVWATGVLAFHVIYSIGLPILLLGLALPSTRGRSLIGARGVVTAFATLALSTGIEMAIVYRTYQFWLGPGLLLASLAVIALLVYAAYRLPARFASPSGDRATLSPAGIGILGFAFFPLGLVLEYGLAPTATPPALEIAIELAVFAVIAETVRRGLGRRNHDYLLVHLAFGFVLWQAVFGLLLTLGLPYTLPLVAVAVLFFLRLRAAYRPASDASAATIPPGAGGARLVGPSEPHAPA